MLNAKRRKLVEENMSVAIAIAKRMYRTSGLPYRPSIRLDDLVSFGYFGLVDAATRFDSKRGINFGSFASRRIEGAIYDGIRGTDCISKHFRKQQAAQNKRVVMQPVSPADTDKPSRCRPLLDVAITQERVTKVLSLVPEEHKEIFIRYFFRHERMSDIGRRVGLSESRISQRLRLAIIEVRSRLCPHMLGDKTPLGWHNRGVRARA